METVTPEQLLDTPDLLAVGAEGDDVRRRKHGARTTFNRVFEVHVSAPVHALPPHVHAGEFRIVGRPPTLEALVAAVRATTVFAGETPVTVFSVADLLSLREPLQTIAAALKDAGASAVVQLHIDVVEDPEPVILGLRAAGLEILTVAIDELADDQRLEMCSAAATLQRAVGGFRSFAPLPRQMSVTKPTTGYDDVKMVALARIVAENIESIQVDWALYGPKLAQVALTVGADDIDNVAALDPGVLGTRRSPLEEIKGNIKAASLEAHERDGLFRVNSQLLNSQLPSRAD
jgi:aminodeoxyfutalosine synthase